MSAPDLKRLRVAFIAGTLGQGGAERQLYYILRALKSCGSSVRLLSLTRGEFWENPIRELGIPVIWVGEKTSRAARCLRVIRELRQDPPHIVHSQHFYTNLYAVVAARVMRAREIGAIRNDVWSEVRDNGPLLGRLSLRVPAVMVANSKAGIHNAIQCGVAAKRLHLLANVVDTDRFRPVPHFGLKTELSLLAAGRMVPQKRHDRLLRVIARVRQQARVPIRLTIAGDGPLRASTEEQAARLGLSQDAVTFLGAVADLVPVYQAADIFLLTSDHEGTPNVLLEAMACGLPVIATRAGGVPEVVEDGVSGYLVEPSDEEMLIRRILSLLAAKDQRLEIGRAARRRMETNYSPETLSARLQQIYRAALA
jgi:glycosyltransferase involved in cell wall biosynthesis